MRSTAHPFAACSNAPRGFTWAAFPKRFGIVEVDTEDAPPSRQTRPSPNNVVASAQRATAPKKIRLSLTQQNVAKKLGIPLELYAKKVAELEAQNG